MNIIKNVLLMVSFLLCAKSFASMTFGPGYIDVDISAACTNSIRSKTCTVESNNIRVTINCGSNLTKYNNGAIACNYDSNMTISSNLPINTLTALELTARGRSKTEFNVTKSYNLATYRIESNPYFLEIFGNDRKGYYSPGVTRVRLSGGSPETIVNFYQASKNALEVSLQQTLNNTRAFQDEIALSHQGHLDRYISSLQDCIAIMQDRKNYTVLNWRILECSRRVVVFGLVLTELLHEYAHVDRLEMYINSIQGTTQALQDSYGWNRGLAGNASKATSALLEVVKLELREIASIKIASGFQNIELYTDLLSTTNSLIVKINASKAGDMTAQREIWGLVDKWNASNWQTELDRLISAPMDQKQLVLPKLQLMLMAIESLSDLTRANFNIPTID